MKLARYDSYRPSGVPWLGSVPSGWEVSRTRYVCSIETGSRDTVDALPEGAFPFFVRSQQVEAIDTYSYDCEAVLTAGDGVGVGKVFHHFTGRFEAHQRVYVFKDFRTVLGRYFFYYLSTLFSDVAVQGTAKSTVDSLRRPMLADFEVLVPPLDEQQAIVGFIQRETAQIDGLIGKQERLVELLAERRSAAITHAVTHGIEDCADMVDIQSPWLDRIPRRWTWIAFRYVAAVNGGLVDPRDEPFADMTLVAPNHIEKGTGVLLAPETAAQQGADSGKYLVEEGEVLYSKIRPHLNKVTLAIEPCLCSADMYAISGRPGVLNNDFLMYLMLSKPFLEFAKNSSMRVAMPKINRDALEASKLWFPDLPTQFDIVRHIKDETARIDVLTAKARQVVAVLSERRSALISAAVTGKIDVTKRIEGAA